MKLAQFLASALQHASLAGGMASRGKGLMRADQQTDEE
jgi:hypothetical protein